MLKRLKIKFVVTNLISITVVMVLCFSALYISAKRNITGESIAALQSFVIIPDMGSESQGGVNKPSENKLEIPYFEDAIINKSTHLGVFCVKLDREGNLVAVYEYKENLTAKNKELLNKYSALVLSAREKNGDTGILKEANLRYHVKETTRYKYVSFLDMTFEQESLGSLVKGFYLAMGLSWVVVLAVSLILAGISVRPVEKAWSRQRQFIADASHELKTPLTVILASTDVMLSNEESLGNEQRKWLECTKNEAERMKELLSGMLYLARFDDGTAGEKALPHQTLNLSDLLLESLLGFEIQCFEKGKVLYQSVEENVFVRGNSTELKQLIGIFLDNACKYSGEKGNVWVSLKCEGGKCTLSFKNTGTPIPQKDLPHIFERFYRSSESRAREEGGFGLGLSIASAIAKNHGTKITAESDERGTEFSLRLPIVASVAENSGEQT